MAELNELLGSLDIPPEQMARIVEEAKTNPMAAMGLLNEYLTPEVLQQIIAAFLGNPDALAEVVAQTGVSSEQLAELGDSFGSGAES